VEEHDKLCAGRVPPLSNSLRRHRWWVYHSGIFQATQPGHLIVMMMMMQ